MDDPNPDDPLVSEIANLLKEDKKEHDYRAKIATMTYAGE